MSDCVLRIHDEAGGVVAEHPVSWSGLDELHLSRLYRQHLHAKKRRFAVVCEGRRVHAAYLANDVLPESAVRLHTPRGVRGAWITRSYRLGEFGGGRVFVGPTVFFRQVDLGERDAWLVLALLGFTVDNSIPERRFSNAAVYELELDDGRYFYETRGARWGLWGGGNTPRERIEQVVERESPDSAQAFLWSIGAVKL